MAFCGLDCTGCPVRIATRKDDDSLRRETAKQVNEEFDADFSPEDINCEGCKSKGIKISYWDECEIRKCAVEGELENCGLCDDYPCGKLDEIFKSSPEAKKALDEIRTGM